MKTRFIGAAVAALAITAALLVPAAPAMAASSFQVAWTHVGIYPRSGPSMSASKVGGVLGDGTWVSVQCEQSGTAVTSDVGTSSIWEKLSNGTWLPNSFVNTRVNGWTPGVPRCDAAPVAVQPPVNPGPAPAPTDYGMPFPGGTAISISQNPGNAYSHSNGYNNTAVDWRANTGTPIVASLSGTVYKAWNSGLGGWQLLIDHGNNSCSQYAHMSKFSVVQGQRVLKGQLIGYSGNSSTISIAAHLHWAGVNCNNQTSKWVIPTTELGTNYAVSNTAITSQNYGSALVGSGSNRCIDVAGGNAGTGIAVQLWDCNKTSAQVWKYDAASQQLRVFKESRCLDVSGGKIASGTKIQTWGCNTTIAQKWTLNTDGTIRLAANQKLCLDATGGAKTNGTRLQVFTCNGTAAQIWR